MIKIIQFSDFHLESENLDIKKKNLLSALLLDLEQYFEENNTIFVFTGDCIDKGGASFENQVNAFSFFERHFINPILEKFKVGKERFFFVPGNHDSFRNKVDTFRELGLKQKLSEIHEINQFIKNVKEGGENIPRIEPYKKFEQSFYNEIENKSLSQFDSNFTIKLNGINVGVACLNTSWRCCDDKDSGNLLIGESQILNAIDFLQECEIKIALGHHPIDWLLIADKNVIKPILEREFDFYLYGHTHQISASYSETFYGKIYYNNACATLADHNIDKNFDNGYNIIERNSKSLKISYRKYNQAKNRFITYSEAGSEEGFSKINIPDTAEQKENIQVLNIRDSLSSKIDSLDEHLIIYNTNSAAPCKLKSVFVEPTITNYPDSEAVDTEELIEYSIADIIDNESSFIIFGTKESGKTILLDRIFIEYLENQSTTLIIPVLFNFQEIGNKSIVNLIKNFLNKSTIEVNKQLDQKNIVLLIDDFSFDEKFNHTLTKIKNFISENSTKIVCTTKIVHLRDLPTGFLENNVGFNFETGFIQNLSGKQIKKLIKNWFGLQKVDYHDKLEQILKSFFELSLPRNPLTVSLFLWIIETQEKKPINNTTLVKLFVENLLERANFENIYAETLTFENKQRLLAAVAKHMLVKGDGNLNYQIEYSKLISFAISYFKPRFTVDATKIIENLIERGIFTQKGEFVNFKAPFLFHYFLACNMTYDEAFKDHVLRNENILEFADEVEYFSGLKLSDKNLLSIILKSLNESFEPINSNLRENFNIVDEILDSKDYLSGEVEMKKIKKHTDDEIDEIYNDQFSHLPVKRQIRNKAKSMNRNDSGRLLKLAAVVLKNSEELDDIEVKKLAYQTIILSSISYLLGYKFSLLDYFSKNEKVPKSFPKNINFNLFIKVLPLIHQVMLTDWIGTPKLGITIEELLKEYGQATNISEYEKSLSIFIYSDVRSRDYTTLIKNTVLNFNKKYILDFCFLKLLFYYHMRSKDKKTDEFYLNLLAAIKVKMGYMNKRQKSKYMSKLRNERQLKLFDQNIEKE